MQRDMMRKLIQWKDSKRRKPLLLDGARQVGKTWLLKEFGKSFEDGYIYINFDNDPDMKQLFETTGEVGRLMELLALSAGKPLTPHTLLILDEIQECESAIKTLKYFCEDFPAYFVAASGSLLGISLSNGFPVGKVHHIHMYPMTFSEFLVADGSANLREYTESIKSIAPIPDVFCEKLTEKMKQYFVTGGMPEAVKTWIETHSTDDLDETLEDIIYTYERDMGKHPDKNDVPKVHYIWDSIPSQMAKDSKKFMYRVVREGARAREYENALNWLTDAGILKKVYSIKKAAAPIDAYRDLSAFKVYYNDIGIMRAKSHIRAGAFVNEWNLFEEYKGFLTENYVLQSLIPQFKTPPGYWRDSTHEVDFLFQQDMDVIPLEVKSGKSVKKSASIKKYRELHDPKCSIRLSLKNLSYDDGMLNIPLFLADRISELYHMV